ncbi:hypothetical protein LF1_53990 [Rubripirellula obstinata]|uniref:PsbP C-terminal domain-containing protein n=1 Tax=Rubripirellula obstinata TaxID=406547 RepID=A0A5B1CCE5_9BACT|nr:hypothetical protein [Rubripirellula obstinata]KAA1257250.1 hypothetical protein LF1_53990 [Rubripirellula obstinata]
MLNCKTWIPIIVSLVATVAHAEKPNLPSPPTGFEWQWCEDVSVGILKPHQWHYKTARKNATRGYFITQENIEDTGGFNTGLSLNVIPGVGMKRGGTASEFAKLFIQEATKEKESVLLVIPPNQAGPAQTFGCRIKKDGSVIHNFLIADDANDVVYMFIYESPEQDWEEAWSKGQTMLRKLYIDLPEQ